MASAAPAVGVSASDTQKSTTAKNKNGSSTVVNSDGSITTITANGGRVTTGNDYTAIHNTGQNSASSTANGFTPIYDYTERDYRDIYLEDHDFDLTKYDGYFDATIKQIMNAERAAKINEGWHTKDGKYYFLKNGVPVTGWYKDVVTWYYFNSDGSMKTGWLNDKGDWYYFYDSGAMAQNVCVNGYYMNQYGAYTVNKPENAPTGISYKELTNRLINLGFSHKRRYDYNSKLPFKIDCPDYEFGWYPYYYLTSKCDVCVRDDNTCYISTNYASGIKDLGNAYHTMLTWLCPTQVNEIYNKINAKPNEKQTIYADGRVIEVSFHLGGLDLKIKDQ